MVVCRKDEQKIISTPMKRMHVQLALKKDCCSIIITCQKFYDDQTCQLQISKRVDTASEASVGTRSIYKRHVAESSKTGLSEYDLRSACVPVIVCHLITYICSLMQQRSATYGTPTYQFVLV